MQFINRKIIGITFLGLFFITASYADEVVMITGEHFTTSKVWEEDGKIRFNMHGLAVSVNKSDVASIMVTGGSTSQAPHREPSPSPAPQQKHASQKELVTAKVSPPPSPHSPVKKIKPKANIQGIGFNGISWHMRPTELPGIEKIKTEEAYGGIDQYWRPDGSMTLGDVLLDGLVFGFWQNRLYSIMLWVDGKSGYDGLQRVVLDRYGTGKKSKTVENRYVWVEDKTTDRLLEFDKERNIGVFWMRSRDLDTHIKRIYPES
jgi:hypothetical protein